MLHNRFDSSAVVLANADFHGTLAATRSLGRHGVPVTVAHDTNLGAASWSRYVRRAVRCPPIHQSRAFLRWLLKFGEEDPGQVLYPTSDDAAFIYSSHRAELSKCFRLYQPPIDAVYSLLNKRSLYEEGRAAGLQVPRTWFPSSAQELVHIGRDTDVPLMIKPVTQVMFSNHRKGDLVPKPSELPRHYRSFAGEPYAPELIAKDPNVVRPMVQEFHPHAGQSIYSLSGFISQEGDWAMRGAMKVLQLPRRLGVGICFEDDVVEPRLAQGIASLCRRVGYYGVFEAEFIRFGADRLLIDFNPRFFGQLGFDLARGLPLAMLAYEGALGHTGNVARLLKEANESPTRTEAAPVFCHAGALELLLRCQEVAGSMASHEASGWRSWLQAHRSVDAVLSDDDRAPATVEAMCRLGSYARHPRAFMRMVVLNR